MDEQGHVLRMDLLVRESWGPLVIDYKSGRLEAEHISQVRRYLSCLEQSGDYGGTARGLLVYLDQRRFQLVEATRVSPLCETCGRAPAVAGDPIMMNRSPFLIFPWQRPFLPDLKAVLEDWQRRPFRFRSADCAA